MTAPLRAQTRWSLIVPVKQTTLAKTRLTGFDRATRRRLALAFALDTVAAARACDDIEHVVVVSNDDDREQFSRLGAALLHDVPDAGLNPALVYAGQHLRKTLGEVDLVAISSDLPALRPDVLSAALAQAGPRGSFVADANGVGTTLAAARFGTEWSPRFGPRSRAAHRAQGWDEIDSSGLERLRRDVDTPVDLWDARRLGVGPHTAAALADAGVGN